MTRRWSFRAAAALLGASACSMSAWQDDHGLDSKADDVIREASAYLGNLTSLELTIAAGVDVQMEGMRQQMTSRHSMAMQRPNRLAITQEHGFTGTTIVCDGQKLYTLVAGMMDAQSTVEDAPDTVGAIAGRARELAMGDITDGTVMGTMLVADDLGGLLLDGVERLAYGGLEDLHGTPCHRLELSSFGALGRGSSRYAPVNDALGRRAQRAGRAR